MQVPSGGARGYRCEEGSEQEGEAIGSCCAEALIRRMTGRRQLDHPRRWRLGGLCPKLRPDVVSPSAIRRNRLRPRASHGYPARPLTAARCRWLTSS